MSPSRRISANFEAIVRSAAVVISNSRLLNQTHAQAVEQMREARVFPLDLKIGDEALHEDDVDRAVADDLEGDMDVAASGVFGLRTDQGSWPPTGAKARMKLSVPSPPDSDRA